MRIPQSYLAPPPGTLGVKFLETAILYVNQATGLRALEIRGDRLVLSSKPKVLGEGIDEALRMISKGRPTGPEVLDIPRTGNDNKPKVLGGILSSLGLERRDTIGAALRKLSEILIEGKIPEIMDPASKAKLPSILKANYMEYSSSYLSSRKKDFEASTLSILLAGLGALASYAARTKDGIMVYILPPKSEILRLAEIHSSIVRLFSSKGMSEMPESAKIIAVASIVAEAGVIIEHVADEVHLQKGNRVTVISTYPYIVGSMAKRLSGAASMLKAFLRITAQDEAVRGTGIKVANSLLAYLSTGSNIYKYASLRELDVAEWLLRRGKGEDKMKIIRAFKRAEISDPVEFLGRLKNRIIEIKAS